MQFLRSGLPLSAEREQAPNPFSLSLPVLANQAALLSTLDLRVHALQNFCYACCSCVFAPSLLSM